MRTTVAIFGIPIDNLDSTQTLVRLEEFIQTGRFHQVATANTDFLIQAHNDPELRVILCQADLVVPDGMPVVLASRFLRNGLKERVTGADLVPRLAEIAAAKKYRIFMLGARPEVALMAKEALEHKYPSIQIVGCISPPNTHIIEMDNEALLERIHAASPDILLVAFGNPKQEKWIHMHRHRLRVPVCIGVGGTFDFLAGAAERAPLWMQRYSLEWLHRVLHEPRRLWKRYARDIYSFSRFLAIHLWTMRSSGKNEKTQIFQAHTGEFTVLSLVGSVNNSILPEFQRLASAALEIRKHLILDFQSASDIDSAFIGTLINLSKRGRYSGCDIRITGLSERIQRALEISSMQHIYHPYRTLAEAILGHEAHPFDIQVVYQESKAIIQVTGRMEETRIGSMEEICRSISPQSKEILYDFTAVTYIDCASMKMLKDQIEWMKLNKQKIRLAAGEIVLEALKREKLLHLLKLEDEPVPEDHQAPKVSAPKPI
jgi:N-acetylglucosaminyldiphosphoundecaprenol N-acetyl-beta-D-mannosaminyltransferase